jgi:hypothetical protein
VVCSCRIWPSVILSTIATRDVDEGSSSSRFATNCAPYLSTDGRPPCRLAAMAHQATGTVVAKKFANAYEESERLNAELKMFERGGYSQESLTGFSL